MYLLAMATVTVCSVVASAVVVVVCSSDDECLCLWSLPCFLWSADLKKELFRPISRLIQDIAKN